MSSFTSRFTSSPTRWTYWLCGREACPFTAARWGCLSECGCIVVVASIKVWYFTDLICLAAPCALFFGRLANFANGELWGRPTAVPWAVIFPHVDALPRHPSQLYEALLEGIVLFLLLVLAARVFRLLRFAGGVTGLSMMGYATMRFTVEFFREPDAHLGLLFGLVSQGQLLSLLFFLCGVVLFAYALKAGSKVREGEGLRS